MSEKKSTSNPTELDYETAFQELEAIVERMETGKQSLENALADFERGVVLMQVCHEKLQQAEQKVEILSQNSNGVLSSSPLESTED